MSIAKSSLEDLKNRREMAAKSRASTNITDSPQKIKEEIKNIPSIPPPSYNTKYNSESAGFFGKTTGNQSLINSVPMPSEMRKLQEEIDLIKFYTQSIYETITVQKHNKESETITELTKRVERLEALVDELRDELKTAKSETKTEIEK